MCVPHFFVVTMGNVPELESFPRGKAGRLTSLIVWKLIDCKPNDIWIAMGRPLAPSSLRQWPARRATLPRVVELRFYFVACVSGIL
jgi:hypothetical protein